MRARHTPTIVRGRRAERVFVGFHFQAKSQRGEEFQARVARIAELEPDVVGWGGEEGLEVLEGGSDGRELNEGAEVLICGAERPECVVFELMDYQ